MDTSNIETLINRLLQDPDSTFMNRVREETSLKDTLKNRFVEAKTPLGQVLQELQNSQESPNRKLLPKNIFNKAEKEAKELTEKEVVLAAKKGSRREVSNEVSHLLKRQSIVYGKIGPEFQVNSYATGEQQKSSAVSLSNGTFVVTWESWEQDGDRYGIYAQVFNVNGTKNGSEFQVNTYTADDQKNPSATNLSNGKFVITWASSRQDGSSYGVYGQIFNADGTKSGLEFQVNTYTAGTQRASSVVSLSGGGFVVTWESNFQDGSTYSIYGQIFNTDGTKNGSEFQINTFFRGLQQDSSVASLSNGKFVVAWQSDGQDRDFYGVYGQMFNEDGTKNGSEFQINTNTGSSHLNPSVASLSNDKFVVTWNTYDGDLPGIYGQMFNEDGTKNGSEFQVNTYTTNTQMLPSVGV